MIVVVFKSQILNNEVSGTSGLDPGVQARTDPKRNCIGGSVQVPRTA